jgi:hypothetical protein
MTYRRILCTRDMRHSWGICLYVSICVSRSHMSSWHIYREVRHIQYWHIAGYCVRSRGICVFSEAYVLMYLYMCLELTWVRDTHIEKWGIFHNLIGISLDIAYAGNALFLRNMSLCIYICVAFSWVRDTYIEKWGLFNNDISQDIAYAEYALFLSRMSLCIYIYVANSYEFVTHT